MKLHANAPTINFAALLRGMPDARPNVFCDVGGKDDFHIERIFLHESERGLQVRLDRKVIRLLETVMQLVNRLNAFDREGADLLVLRDIPEEIEPATEVH